MTIYTNVGTALAEALERETLVDALNEYVNLVKDAVKEGVPVEFRVKDAPNSVWQDMTAEDEIDVLREEYRLKPTAQLAEE